MNAAAELDAIAAEAAQAEAAAAPVAQPAAPQVDPAEILAKELAGLAQGVVAMLSPALPSLAGIYNDATIGAASASLAAVCVKHGWLQGGVMGGYQEEIMALMVCGPLALATWQGVRADLAKLKAQAGDGAPTADPPPAPPAADQAAGHTPMTLRPVS